MRSSPPTMPMISKRMPEIVPFSTVPDAIVMSSSARMISCVSSTESSWRPMAAATRWSTGPHASEIDPGDSSSDCDGSCFPKPMISNIVKGLSHVA